MKCTEYELREYNWIFDERPPPCHCPICGGFLKWDGDIPVCNKCHTELIMLPEIIDDVEMEWGKICPISLPRSLHRKVNENE